MTAVHLADGTDPAGGGGGADLAGGAGGAGGEVAAKLDRVRGWLAG